MRVVRDGLMTELDGGEPCLLGGACASCGLRHFPAQEVCPYCSADGCSTIRLSSTGRLDLCTTVINRPPGYEGPLPFGFGVVELTEGVRIITRVREPLTARPGAAMRLVWDNVGAAENEVLTYAFEPNPVALNTQHSGPSIPPHSAPRTQDSALRTDFPPGSRPVYVAGVGLHPFGRFADATISDLGIAAVRAALADAGLKRGDFQSAYCGTVYGGVAAGHKVLTALGLTGVPIVNVEAGCASGAAALRLGAAAVASGECDTVLVFGVEKMPKGMIRSSFFEPWREQAGLAVTPAYFALRAQKLMRDSAVSLAQLAQVAVKNHRHGVHNPNAMYRKEISAEAILASPMVCDPLRLLMMCAPNEGAAAVVLSARPSPVRLRAVALRSHLPGHVLGEQTPLSGLCHDDIASPTQLAAADAYASAGVGPQDLDVIELQDTDSARELLSYEELGLCARGTSGEWLDAGHSTMTGRQPVNPSGGLLSKGEPLGASGLGQVVELYWQLRQAAGARQVPGARLALAHCVGRGANAAVVILARE